VSRSGRGLQEQQHNTSSLPISAQACKRDRNSVIITEGHFPFIDFRDFASKYEGSCSKRN